MLETHGVKAERAHWPGGNFVMLATWATVLLLALGAGATPAQPSESGSPPQVPAATAKDPSAMALLKRMCDRLQAARTFTVRGQVSLELPVAGGNLATFFNDYEVAVRRPDGLSAHRFGDQQLVERHVQAPVLPRGGEHGVESSGGAHGAPFPLARHEHGH